MLFLIFTLLLPLALCQNEILIGYLSTGDKLRANLTNGEVNATVKARTQFDITVATVTPYRWIMYTPYMYPFISCKQKIIDKPSSSSGPEEILQIYQCKGNYPGTAYIKLKLKSMDSRLNLTTPLESKVWVNITYDNITDELNQTVPSTIPTHPSVKEIPEEVIASNPYNRWNKKKAREEELIPEETHTYNDDYYNYYGSDDDFYKYFDDDDLFLDYGYYDDFDIDFGSDFDYGYDYDDYYDDFDYW